MLAFIGILALMVVSFMLGGYITGRYLRNQYDATYGKGEFEKLYYRIKDTKVTEETNW